MQNCPTLNAPCHFSEAYAGSDRDYIEQPYDVPDSEWSDEPDEDSDDFLWPPTDDADWDVFIPDDGDYEVEPDRHDFAGSEEPDAWRDE
jgi:hypothetical protein